VQKVLAEALTEPEAGSASDPEPLTSLAIQKASWTVIYHREEQYSQHSGNKGLSQSTDLNGILTSSAAEVSPKSAANMHTGGEETAAE